MKELLIFADRSDITEEVVRLESHVGQAMKLLGTGKSVGRQLDFFVQEMFREINTIGSKAADIGLGKRVIAFKTELEKFREQAQNVE